MVAWEFETSLDRHMPRSLAPNATSRAESPEHLQIFKRLKARSLSNLRRYMRLTAKLLAKD